MEFGKCNQNLSFRPEWDKRFWGALLNLSVLQLCIRFSSAWIRAISVISGMVFAQLRVPALKNKPLAAFDTSQGGKRGTGAKLAVTLGAASYNL